MRSRDTVYIHAPAEDQALAAPLVCGLLAEIRRATYHAHHQAPAAHGGCCSRSDEVANIAPLAELPAIASEGGGQGLALLAAFQDLSQARARWGPAADGFLTLFGSKLILPGVADPKTIEGISLALGEYDRQIISSTETRPPATLFGPHSHAHRGQTISTQRQRVLSPGEIADIPAGARAAPRRRPLGAADRDARLPHRAVADADAALRERDVSATAGRVARGRFGTLLVSTPCAYSVTLLGTFGDASRTGTFVDVAGGERSGADGREDHRGRGGGVRGVSGGQDHSRRSWATTTSRTGSGSRRRDGGSERWRVGMDPSGRWRIEDVALVDGGPPAGHRRAAAPRGRER